MIFLSKENRDVDVQVLRDIYLVLGTLTLEHVENKLIIFFFAWIPFFCTMYIIYL